jgi:hypothetical protein
MTYANLVKKTRLQSYARHVDVPVVVNRLEAPCGAGGGPPAREGPQGRPLPPLLPFIKDVGFDTCALTPDIKELYILQAHLDHVGIPPKGCTVYTAEKLVPRIEGIYSRFNIDVDVEVTSAEYIGHVYLKSDRKGTFFESAESYAAVLHNRKIVLIDECDDPASIFARFRERFPDFTITVMRVPYTHSATSYLNNPWKVWPHWLADNKSTAQYAPNVVPKRLVSALELQNAVGQIY